MALGGACLGLALPALAAPAAESEEATGALEEEDGREAILITETRSSNDAYFAIDPRHEANAAVDSAALLKRIPGADVNDNGPLSGQVQYRGMYGTRMNVLIDGAFIVPDCPNWMDTPLHYAPRPLLERLEVERGIASVSSGAETPGGTVRATLKRSAFSEDEAFRVHTDLEATGRSVDRSFAGGGVVSLSNRRHRLHVLGSAELGDDADTPEGEIRASEHERFTYGGGYGIRLGQHEFGVDYRHNDTGETGSPALPMDIVFVDTDFLRGSYTGRWNEVGLNASLDFHDVDHEMDNFTVRPPPVGSRPFRFSRTSVRGLGYGATADFAVWKGALSAGVDGNLARHDMRIADPTNAAFFVNNFNDVRRDRHGTFAEWRGSPFDRWQFELGARYTRTEFDAGLVDALAAQISQPARALRDAFNAAEHRQSDDLFEWLVRLAFSPRDALRIELAIARKMRAPYYVERYAWLPLQATGGLADGHNYVGDIDLDPELSREVEGGVRWRGRWLSLAPRAFYRRVDDYIQGVKIAPPQDPLDAAAIMVSTASGDPDPLRFSNVDAVFYGVDVEYGLRLPFHFDLEGVLSYVRAERRDVDDDLYRIAPLRGRTALRYRWGGWSASVEGVYAARQQHVAAENDENETPGYGLLNLFVLWEPGGGVGISAGVDNVLDAFYQDHLYGINRVRDSAVAVGERLPGYGRSFFGSISWRW